MSTILKSCTISEMGQTSEYRRCCAGVKPRIIQAWRNLSQALALSVQRLKCRFCGGRSVLSAHMLVCHAKIEGLPSCKGFCVTCLRNLDCALADYKFSSLIAMSEFLR